VPQLCKTVIINMSRRLLTHDLFPELSIDNAICWVEIPHLLEPFHIQLGNLAEMSIGASKINLENSSEGKLDSIDIVLVHSLKLSLEILAEHGLVENCIVWAGSATELPLKRVINVQALTSIDSLRVTATFELEVLMNVVAVRGA